jgi:hypothetical protein
MREEWANLLVACGVTIINSAVDLAKVNGHMTARDAWGDHDLVRDLNNKSSLDDAGIQAACVFGSALPVLSQWNEVHDRSLTWVKASHHFKEVYDISVLLLALDRLCSHHACFPGSYGSLHIAFFRLK